MTAPTPTPTPAELAQKMKERLEQIIHLSQDDAVWVLQTNNGHDYIYTNENGNPAIDKRVLKEFNKLTPDVVWDRSQRYWRKRMPYDRGTGRQV